MATYKYIGSADSDGSIVQTDWDFSDGATGSGPTTSHTFAIAGTYPVRVTVTDDPQVAVDTLTRFFTNFHSLRYVERDLVLRLRRLPTPDALLEKRGLV